MMEAEIHRSTRYNYEFSVIFIDLDYFKQVNDQHGHLIGSKLLAQVGIVLQQHLRLIDMAFRYGGDEIRDHAAAKRSAKRGAVQSSRWRYRLHHLLREARLHGR